MLLTPQISEHQSIDRLKEKKKWRKEAADIPPFEAENDLYSTRLALFRVQPQGDS